MPGGMYVLFLFLIPFVVLAYCLYLILVEVKHSRERARGQRVAWEGFTQKALSFKSKMSWFEFTLFLDALVALAILTS